MNRSSQLMLTAAFLAVLASSLNGCGTATSSATRSSDIASLTGDTTSGQTLYTSNCSSCHGSDGQSGSVSKNLTAKSSAEIISTVLTGTGSMPSFSDLSDQDIADVTAYVEAL